MIHRNTKENYKKYIIELFLLLLLLFLICCIRFFGASPWTKIYRDRYWHTEHFESIENLKGLLKEIYPEENVSIAEAAYRWIYHHSALKDNDAVIVGASSIGQLEMNLDYTGKGPLDERIVEFFEAWWKNTSHLCPTYFR